MGADVRRHQRSDRRLRSSRPAAARQHRARGAPQPAGDRHSWRDLRRRRTLWRRVPGVRDRAGAGARRLSARRRGAGVHGRHARARRTRRDHPGRRADPQRHDVPRRRRRGAGRVGRAGGQERHRGDSLGATAEAHERRAGQDQRPADRHGRSPQVDAGAIAPGREALGHRPARGRRGARAEQSA